MVNVSTRADCQSLGKLLGIFGDKWTIPTVACLTAGPVRFNELRRRVDGVSHRMLTLTLRSLEANGFVQRKVYPTVPAQVEYQLTDLGISLVGALRTLAAWATDNQRDPELSRTAGGTDSVELVADP